MPATAPTRSAPRIAHRPVWGVLGATDLRRLVLHPVFLGSLAFIAITVGVDLEAGPREAYTVVTSAVIFFVGPFAFFAANLLATTDRRHGSEEWLSSLPASRRDRTAAVLLACAGPAAVAASAVCAAFAAGGHLVQKPAALEVAAVPLAVLGGGLLGVMVAR